MQGGGGLLTAAILAVLFAQGLTAPVEPWGSSGSKSNGARREAVVTLWNEALPSVSAEVLSGASAQTTVTAAVNSHSVVAVPLGLQPGALHVRVFSPSNASIHWANVSYGPGSLDVGVSVVVLDCNGTLCVQVLLDNLEKHLNDGIDIARLRVRDSGPPNVPTAQGECTYLPLGAPNLPACACCICLRVTGRLQLYSASG
jgi:hypothetical protein